MPKRTIAGDLPAPMLAKVQPEMPVGEAGPTSRSGTGSGRSSRRCRGAARLASRDGRPLGRYFPELLELLERPEVSTEPFVADAEIVRVAPGRMDFDELQLRLHPAESRVRKLAGEIPATLIVFDLLGSGRRGSLDVPLAERRERLTVLAAARGWAPAPGAWTSAHGPRPCWLGAVDRRPRGRAEPGSPTTRASVRTASSPNGRPAVPVWANAAGSR